ncbi:MAG: GAF domain-containing protein [Alphaproteobacteria bacterium]|nr:GAF domain-containing protein [Alphaproteobacteria bacterium]
MLAHGVADQLHMIDRAVATLTRATEALLKAADEVSLLEDICRIAVDVAGYRLAWVGMPEHTPDRKVSAVAAAGQGRSYLQEIDVAWDDGPLGRGPVGTAIRTGRTQVVRSIETHADFAPWREAASRHGFRAVVSLPLGEVGDIVGALNIYAGEPAAFDDDTVRLLEDVARNLTYGVRALRIKAEHDKAVRDLAESEERYRSLVEMTPDAILVHSKGVILYANPAAGRVFGAEGRPMSGLNVVDLVPAEMRDTIARRVANPPIGRVLAEHPMCRIDGTPFDAEVVGSSVAYHGHPARFLVIRDVTERRQVQEQLVQTSKLATLGEMAAGLVHELSQPLNIIRLTAEGALLFMERGKATPEWQAQQFELIAEQSQRTAEIIDDIRIFSRRDSSPIQVFDAIGAVRSALAVLEGQMRPDEIEVETDLPEAMVPVRGRRVQLEQVIMNLLSNAHHALKEKQADQTGGWVATVAVSARRRGDGLVITVEDTGPGIPPAVRPRIFEPFFTTKEAGRGTGLGLSVSFGIINSMGGRLEIQDRAIGACFTITLPVDDLTGIGHDPEVVPPPQNQLTATGHIMVVDDEKTAAATVGRYLEELGHRVTLCTSGSQAYETFMRDPADVVITDLRMPAGGGEQLVERLRDFDPLLPIIIVTGHLGATERLAENLQDDRCTVLKKPVALARLGDIVIDFLQPPGE